ncbi:MAG: AsmA family protein, partial [Gemmatimonadota bacterium]|nr:AsmA family protein [Gemmatimonadota bacterium]
MSDQDISTPGKGRWILRLGAAALGLLGVLIVVVVVAARGIDPDDLARWLEPRLEAATGRSVDIASARVALFPPVAVALEDVAIQNPEGMAGDPFISVEELRLDVSVMQLLRRRIRVDEIRLQAPQLRVVVDADGRSNADGFGLGAGQGTVQAPGSGGRDRAPFQVDIELIRIDNGTLSYRDVGSGRAVVVAPLTARTRVASQDGDRWTLETSASARIGARISEGQGGRLGPWDVEIDGTGGAQDEFKTIRLDDGQIRIEELAFALTAGLDRDDQGEGGYRASVTGAALDAARLVSLMPDSTLDSPPDLGGRISLDLGVSGTLGSGAPPIVDGSVDLDEVYIAEAGRDPLLTGLRGTWFLAGDSVWTTETEGVALGGPLRVRGLLRLGDVSGFIMRIAAQPDLGRLGSVVALPDSVAVSGVLSLDVTARGTMANPAGANLSGRLMPENVSLTLPGVGVPVGLPSGTVILGAEGARWSDLPVRLGADSFVSTGGLADWAAWTRGDGSVPVFDGSFAGERFDMDAVFPAPPPDSTVLYGKLVFAQLGERRIRDRTPAQILEDRGILRPDSLSIGGEVRLSFGTFLSAPYALSDVRARVEFGPRIVRVHDVVAGAYGG